MTDQFKKSDRAMSETTIDATSSQGLACGTTHLTSHDGRKIVGFGPEAAPANLILQQVDKKVRRTIGIYGQNGSASSQSAALQLSLESKLQTQFPWGGLTLFIKGWKRKTTPLGRLYCQLAVSARPINETDYGLWHTPRTVMIEETPENFRAPMNSKRSNDRKEGLPNLAVQALWATPAVRDHKDTGDLSKSMVRKDGKERNDTLGRQAYGSTARTGNKGSLNPEFPCWLMGIPSGWVSSIVRGMQSYRKSQQDSYEALYRGLL